MRFIVSHVIFFPLFSRVAELGDLAIAARHSSGTDSDDDDDEGSFERKVHRVPTRMQLAEQPGSRSELFRQLGEHRFETAARHVRTLSLVARRCANNKRQQCTDDTDAIAFDLTSCRGYSDAALNFFTGNRRNEWLCDFRLNSE